MRSIRHKIDYSSRSDQFTLWPLTDWHVGAKAFNEKLFKQHVKAIADDSNAFWLGGGDFIDGICQVGDKRYHPESLAAWLLGETDVMQCEADYAAELVRPIAGKCIGLIEGNHEQAAKRFYGRDIYWYFCQRLAGMAKREPGELALGVQGFVNLLFTRTSLNSKGSQWNFILYSHHGYGGSRLAGGNALTLERTMNDYIADLYLLGHRHRLQVLPKTFTSCNGTKVKVSTRWAAFVPSYLDAYIDPSHDNKPIDTYAEIFGLPPANIGSFPIIIYPNNRSFEIRLPSAQVTTQTIEGDGQ